MILVSILSLWALLNTLWGRSGLVFVVLYRFKHLFSHKTRKLRISKARVSLLIPAHNEELVIEDTILGALAAGVKRRDIYVVDDSSTDRTFKLAKAALGEKNTLRVKRSGKAGSLTQAIEHFKLGRRYDWIQMIDADSVFSPDYFTEIRKCFRPGVVAVIGQVKSLENNWLTSFRTFEYTIGHDFYKYIQSLFNMIAIMPGPATCLSTKILPKITFATDTLTEDFDLTIQIHHQKLGRIAYAPSALSFTQDPSTLSGYIRQVNRWYTGFFQVLKKYRVGTKLRKIDLLLIFLAIDGVFYAFEIVVLSILSLIRDHNLNFMLIFAVDFIVLSILVIYAALRTGRLDVILPLPLYYIIRVINLVLFIWAPIKVYLIERSLSKVSWNTPRIMSNSLALSTLKGGEVK